VGGGKPFPSKKTKTLQKNRTKIVFNQICLNLRDKRRKKGAELQPILYLPADRDCGAKTNERMADYTPISKKGEGDGGKRGREETNPTAMVSCRRRGKPKTTGGLITIDNEEERRLNCTRAPGRLKNEGD